MSVIADYYFNFNEGKTKEELEALHERTARKIYHVCKENGGLYIKFGQAIALQGTVLPPQFQKYLSLLFDKAPNITRKELEFVLNRSFDYNVLEDFEEFSYEPVASASIAQVHKIKVKDTGEYLALKVQKPAIEKQIWYDMLVYRNWCRLLEWRYEFPLTWSLEYAEKHFRMETDFIQEAKNAELAAKVLATDRELAKNVKIPKVNWKYTNRMVIAAEWIDGLSLVKPEAVIETGINVTKLVDLVVNSFAQQLFLSGHLHGDPHPGNLMVQLTSLKDGSGVDGKPKKVRNSNDFKLVLLDHGLYIHESERFRIQHAKFWKSIFLQDTETTREIAKLWGIQNSDFLSSMILFRPPIGKMTGRRGSSSTNGIHGHISGQESERKDAPEGDLIENTEFERQMRSKRLAMDFFSDSSKLPPELMFVMRNMSMVRSINKSFGSPVNRIKIMADYAAVGSTMKHSLFYTERAVPSYFEEDSEIARKAKLFNVNERFESKIIKGIWGYLTSNFSMLRYKLSLFLLDSVFYFHYYASFVSAWIQGEDMATFRNSATSRGNFEVVMDQTMAERLEKRLGYKIDPNLFNA
ncbi:ABC1 family protein [Zancudomyces culisetae]|uniref:ABC1 family protein n=1 Tax=Zancudomyces culisetae TaxID=1213189 RepID=A0A1R1PHE3_ZANCU|nr:ABC1 family protein [Zancudomyces culisetae]|eukprot:OMH80349.1 ABC1 family protein [Zancudomyces culisetae]